MLQKISAIILCLAVGQIQSSFAGPIWPAVNEDHKAANTVDNGVSYPNIAWQYQPESFSDGTRSYVIRQPGPFASPDPGPDRRYTVPTADGAYVIIPTNTAGGSNYLRFLYTPYLFSVRGLQILKFNAQGTLAWQRFIALENASALAIDNLENNTDDGLFLRRVVLDHARATSSGGLALLINGSYFTFGAQGQELASVSSYCDNDLDFMIDEIALNAEGILVAWSATSNGVHRRVCAIDTDGTELDRAVYLSAPALRVVDYKRNVGFLSKFGDFNAGIWSNATLSLQSGSTVRWSKSGSVANSFDGFFGFDERHILPLGEVITFLNRQLTKLDVNGNTFWQLTDPELADYQVKDWLGNGAILLGQDFMARYRVINADGSERWRYDGLPTNANALIAQLLPTRLRLLQAEQRCRIQLRAASWHRAYPCRRASGRRKGALCHSSCDGECFL